MYYSQSIILKTFKKTKKKKHFRTVSDFLHLEALSFIWDRFVSAFTVHVWSNVSLSALASVVNLRRVLSPSAAAWLTCPRWSRHRTSLRCLLWCQTNNTTGERRTWRNHANEPWKERSKENGNGANLVTNVALWKVEIVVWIFDNCYNVLIQFIWLLLQLQEKLYFWPRGPVYVLNIPSDIFNYIENLKIASSKRHISVSLSMEDYCPVWALSWHTLQSVRHHVTPQCVRPCLPSLLGHVECTPTPPSPWTRQLGERVNKHNKPLLWIFSLGPSLPLRPQPPCPGPDSQTSKSCSHKKFTDGSA